jgi:putative cardiolipin synthase
MTYFYLLIFVRCVTDSVMSLRAAGILLFCLCWLYVPAVLSDAPSIAHFRDLANQYPDKTGVYVLEKGEESLLARAWLTDSATRTIDIQYFIWSTDNIGTLASEALLRAADRGVRVRVIVDDLMIDAEHDTLLALAAHENVHIRIYNPQYSVGTSMLQRLGNLIKDFRAVNQRMHDKTALFDGLAGITGGRNMADEYFDYDYEYNFRDRDVLLVGSAAEMLEESFERFWNSPLAVPVEQQLQGERLTADVVAAHHAWLHDYAQDPENYTPRIRSILDSLEVKFSHLSGHLVWCDARVISDEPGKNDGSLGLKGSGTTTMALVSALEDATTRVTIQSPYVVLTDEAMSLFADMVQRGVQVRIVTNSLASTDNLQAFSGYHKKRDALLAAGIELYEFRPHPMIQYRLNERHAEIRQHNPVFAVHAKTMVIDGESLFIGTFNLDPRSANLNTEIGVQIESPLLARQVEAGIEQDMRPQNSWSPLTDTPDDYASLDKRIQLWFWELLPLEPVL